MNLSSKPAEQLKLVLKIRARITVIRRIFIKSTESVKIVCLKFREKDNEFL